MSSHLLVTVRFHEGRYHGAGDWPPSPARLFQALVAGAGLKGPLSPDEVAAFEWLEVQPFPIIAAPRASKGQAFVNYVPNNDLDAVGGNPGKIGAIRAKKQIRPIIFDDAERPLHYAWRISPDPEPGDLPERICRLAEKLYQLGRGVDLAWACCEAIGDDELEMRLAEYPGEIYRPSSAGTGRAIPCPIKGSFRSLADRYAFGSRRFETVVVGRSISQSFRRQPKVRFLPVHYNSPPVRAAFEIRAAEDLNTREAWPLVKATMLIEAVRDSAFARLIQAFPAKEEVISRWLIGRKPDGSNGGSPADRIRLVPLPSIGSAHSDHQIRRILVEIPPGCPLGSADVSWAFNGLTLGDEGSMGCLISSSLGNFSTLYGIEYEACDWSTVTPVALPDSAKRRRIDPTRKSIDAKNASERAMEQYAAQAAVHAALRHAGIATPVHEIFVQREPFQSHGMKSDSFASGPRFQKERLWHVRLRFASRLTGPLVLGDGRFLGLGVFKPDMVHVPSKPDNNSDELPKGSAEDDDA